MTCHDASPPVVKGIRQFVAAANWSGGVGWGSEYAAESFAQKLNVPAPWTVVCIQDSWFSDSDGLAAELPP